jgi:hypothetical protein
VSAQSFSPISPAMTGTLAMTGLTWLIQHDVVEQALKL